MFADDDRKVKNYLKAIAWLKNNRESLDPVYLGLLNKIEENFK